MWIICKECMQVFGRENKEIDIEIRFGILFNWWGFQGVSMWAWCYKLFHCGE